MPRTAAQEACRVFFVAVSMLCPAAGAPIWQAPPCGPTRHADATHRAALAQATRSWMLPSSGWGMRCRPRCGCCTACTTGRSWSLTAWWVLAPARRPAAAPGWACRAPAVPAGHASCAHAYATSAWPGPPGKACRPEPGPEPGCVPHPRPSRWTTSAQRPTSRFSTACLGVSRGAAWPLLRWHSRRPATGGIAACAYAVMPLPLLPALRSKPASTSQMLRVCRCPSVRFPRLCPAASCLAGYSFYSHLVSCRMLPLRRMVKWTRTARAQLDFPLSDRRVLFAASHK